MFWNKKKKPAAADKNDGDAVMADDLKTLVLVGHCGPDMFMLKNAIKRAVPGAGLVTANDSQGLADYLHDGAVLLVNRILDGRFNTNSGIELISTIANSKSEAGNGVPAMILISNYEESQQQAIEAGALQGFGKGDLYEQSTTDILRDAAEG